MSAPVLSREALWGLLNEAAEIEHNLMCCYLYAFFSLRDADDPALTPEEGAAVERWRAAILGVAIEEMAHLANVSNILSALGAPAHFLRQNFPVPPGYHPAGVVVRLAPFSLETIDHFIYLERPENVQIDDGAGFAPERTYQRDMTNDRATPVARDYATVGQLYASIEASLVALAEAIGEDALFCGDAEHQVSESVAGIDGVRVVRCLKTACAAIEAIVAQGEGSAHGAEGSHYARFCAVRAEFLTLKAARDGFYPAWPCAHNPVMRQPPTPEGKVWVSAEPAASLLDLGNALYNHAIRLLALAYAGVAAPVQKRLVGASVEIMHALTPLARALGRLPADPANPLCTAGLSFATLRSLASLAPTPVSLTLVADRCRELAGRASTLGARESDHAALLDATAALLQRLADRLDLAPPPAPAAAVAAPAPAAASAGAPQPEALPDGREAIPGRDLTLLFDGKRCIHARHCVTGLPQVFKANVEGAWIDPDATTTEALLTVAHMCPSGAIGYARHDGGPDEGAPPVNLVHLRENGPLGVRADMRLDGQMVGYRAVLCRCGASRNKPFCDGSHNTIGFVATGEPATRPSEPLAARGGVLAIDPETNGPLVVTGNLEICAGTGRTVDRVTEARLCRCGGSANKPFCDMTHRKIGFRS